MNFRGNTIQAIRDSILKISCNEESEAISMNFSCWALKSIFSILHFNESVIFACFCSVIHWSFRKYWLIELYRPFKCLHVLLYKILKNHICNLTTDLIRNVFTSWEAVKLIIADTGFPKFWFSLWNLNKNNQLFSLKQKSYFAHFWENVCQIPKSE